MMLNSDQHAGRKEISPSKYVSCPSPKFMAQDINSTYLKSQKTEFYLKSKTVCGIIHYKFAIFILFFNMLF